MRMYTNICICMYARGYMIPSISPKSPFRLYRIMRDVDVSAEEQAKRVLDMVGDSVFKNLAMRVLDIFMLSDFFWLGFRL